MDSSRPIFVIGASLRAVQNRQESEKNKPKSKSSRGCHPNPIQESRQSPHSASPPLPSLTAPSPPLAARRTRPPPSAHSPLAARLQAPQLHGRRSLPQVRCRLDLPPAHRRSQPQGGHWPARNIPRRLTAPGLPPVQRTSRRDAPHLSVDLHRPYFQLKSASLKIWPPVLSPSNLNRVFRFLVSPLKMYILYFLSLCVAICIQK